MHKSDFHYELPEELIAQQPITPRSASRLLVLDRDRGGLSDRTFTDLPALVRGDELFVFNNTRVIPARLFGRKEQGGRVEVMIERILGPERALVQLRASKATRIGQRIRFDGVAFAQVVAAADGFFELALEDASWERICAEFGHVPLPPYIRREDDLSDRDRYQTVFARVPGAVAAPTAGLHFDQSLLKALDARGVESAFVTLHVGAGTFQPLRVEKIESHVMHAEYAEIPETACAQIELAKMQGRPVVAVGTTVVRTLESVASATGTLRPFVGDISSFIYPGYSFKMVDALVTNFHLPESTLLMLVCAFAGMPSVLRAYEHAVRSGYRFFSYGDAMFIRSEFGPRN